jgi:hypothetical protein
MPHRLLFLSVKRWSLSFFSKRCCYFFFSGCRFSPFVLSPFLQLSALSVSACRLCTYSPQRLSLQFAVASTFSFTPLRFSGYLKGLTPPSSWTPFDSSIMSLTVKQVVSVSNGNIEFRAKAHQLLRANDALFVRLPPSERQWIRLLCDGVCDAPRNASLSGMQVYQDLLQKRNAGPAPVGNLLFEEAAPQKKRRAPHQQRIVFDMKVGDATAKVLTALRTNEDLWVETESVSAIYDYLRQYMTEEALTTKRVYAKRDANNGEGHDAALDEQALAEQQDDAA